MKKLILIFLFNFLLINTSYALIEVDITRGNLDPLPIAVSPLHVDIKSEDYKDLKIKELGEEISALKEKKASTFVFSNDNYKTSAALNFFMNEKVYAQNIIGLPALHFDYLGDDLSALRGKNALFIDSDERFKNEFLLEKANPLLSNYFATVTQLAPIIIKINERERRKFWVFFCTDYQPKK